MRIGQLNLTVRISLAEFDQSSILQEIHLVLRRGKSAAKIEFRGRLGLLQPPNLCFGARVQLPRFHVTRYQFAELLELVKLSWLALRQLYEILLMSTHTQTLQLVCGILLLHFPN